MQTWAVRLIVAAMAAVTLPVLDGIPAQAAVQTNAAAVTATTANSAGAAEAQFLRSLNTERASRGLTLLTRSTSLDAVARAWSLTMSSDSRLAHRPDLAVQVTVAERGWTRAGENVGYGSDVDALHRAFLNSPAHFDNVVGDWTKVGVGVVIVDGTMWVTFNFVRSAPVPTARATRKHKRL
jgi:uncharacterized protein YkwD